MSANKLSSVSLSNLPQKEYSDFLDFLQNRNYTIGQFSYCQFIYEKKPIIAFDTSFRILFINDLMKNLLEKDVPNVNGQLLPEVVPIYHKSSLEKFLSPWNEIIRNGLLIGKKYNCNAEFTQGKSTPVSLTGSPLFDKRGKFIGGVVFFTQANKYN